MPLSGCYSLCGSFPKQALNIVCQRKETTKQKKSQRMQAPQIYNWLLLLIEPKMESASMQLPIAAHHMRILIIFLPQRIGGRYKLVTHGDGRCQANSYFWCQTIFWNILPLSSCPGDVLAGGLCTIHDSRQHNISRLAAKKTSRKIWKNEIQANKNQNGADAHKATHLPWY